MPALPRILALLMLTLIVPACSAGDQPQVRRSAIASPTTSASASPSRSAEVRSTFFGSHDHDPIGSWPDGPVGSLRAWDAGVTWREIEVAPGTFDFSKLDAMVDAAEQHDSDVLLVLGQTPAFHALDPTAESFYGEGASSPPELSAWKKYVRTVAERYAGRPVVLQVWNEANVTGFWSGTPQQMAELTKATHDVVQDVRPRPTLVAPALVTRLTGQRAWIDEFYATSVDGTPVADFVDDVSLQLYPDAEGTPETSMTLLAAMRTVLAAHDVQKPIWNTEINYGLTGTEVKPAGTRQQQSNVLRTYILNAANGIERVYWYGWDQQSIVDTLLVEPDQVTLTPAGKAYRIAHRWLIGATVSGCTEGEGGTWACTLDRPDGTSHVYWNTEATRTVPVPDGATQSQVLGRAPQPVQPGSTIEVGLLPVMVGPGR
jgi:hypothetical protein